MVKMLKKKKVKEMKSSEVQDEVLNYIDEMIVYWSKEESRNTTEKLAGLAYSILSILDGEVRGFPQFIVAPLPHPKDNIIDIEEGEDYYPENHKVFRKIRGNISGNLSTEFVTNSPETIIFRHEDVGDGDFEI